MEGALVGGRASGHPGPSGVGGWERTGAPGRKRPGGGPARAFCPLSGECPSVAAPPVLCTLGRTASLCALPGARPGTRVRGGHGAVPVARFRLATSPSPDTFLPSGCGPRWGTRELDGWVCRGRSSGEQGQSLQTAVVRGRKVTPPAALL